MQNNTNFQCVNAIISRPQIMFMIKKIQIRKYITQHTVFALLLYSMKCLSLITKHEQIRYKYHTCMIIGHIHAVLIKL